jgi:hypothetical protein
MKEGIMKIGKYAIAAIIVLGLCGCKAADREDPAQPAKASEVESALAAALAAQADFFAKNNAYADTFAKLGWKPPEGHAYAYFLPGEVIQPAAGGPFQPIGGLAPSVATDGFVILAVGNLDKDPTLDIWQVDQTKEVRRVVDDSQF